MNHAMNTFWTTYSSGDFKVPTRRTVTGWVAKREQMSDSAPIIHRQATTQLLCWKGFCRAPMAKGTNKARLATTTFTIHRPIKVGLPTERVVSCWPALAMKIAIVIITKNQCQIFTCLLKKDIINLLSCVFVSHYRKNVYMLTMVKAGRNVALSR